MAMDLSADPPTTTRSRRPERSTTTANSQSAPPSYGYHNTFHTHANPVLTSPPSYTCANSPSTLHWLTTKALAEKKAVRANEAPPPYTCTVELEGTMGMKQELKSVFEISRTREWNDVYVVLRGTQLSVHRIKYPGILSKSRAPAPGRLLKTFTLQHAEAGVAADFKKPALTPKSPFAHLVPASARQKLYETDPHLFEPVREHVLRLRLETEQFLLCAKTQEDMLTWAEQLCAAIDISPPLEDRSEPRYRSLPRRTRRQRVLDGSRLGENLDNLSTLDVGRRIIAEQEAILRQLYPHLANPSTQESQDVSAPQGADPDREEFDADDVRFPTTRPGSSSRNPSRDGEASAEERPTTSESSFTDPKRAPIARSSQSQALRYRRRCAPALLACSPRVSDVVFSGGQRLRIDTKHHILIGFVAQPPRYDAHNYLKIKRVPKPIELPSTTRVTSTKTIPGPANIERPGSPLRSITDDFMTFGYDMSAASSDQDSDRIRSAAPSEPPSPTALTQAKADAARQLMAMGKRRTSVERGNGLGPVALSASLLL